MRHGSGLVQVQVVRLEVVEQKSMRAPSEADLIAGLLSRPPDTPDRLWAWLTFFTGYRIPRRAVCRGHTSPFAVLARIVLDRPPELAHLGARGVGKSFDLGLAADQLSRWTPGNSTLFLGGSLAQSRQGYRALEDAIRSGRGPYGHSAGEALEDLMAQQARYANGSWVSILAASPRAVRGPHARNLFLDEIDEMDPAIREDAVGMAKEQSGEPGTLAYASTWHKPSGPMSDLIDRGKDPDPRRRL